jgi:hypothetical protein
MKRKSWQTLAIPILLGCCVLVATGQKVGKSIENRRQIKVKISMGESDDTLCGGATFPLLVKLTNYGKDPVAIDTLLVARKIYLRATKSIIDADGKGGSGLQINSDLTSPHFQAQPFYKILKSRESFEAKTFLDLKDPDLRTADTLSIQTEYRNSKKGEYQGVALFVGAERSNELKVDLQGCQNREPK